MTVLLAALAVAVPAPHHDCQSLGCVERVAAKRCTQAHPVSCIHRAAIHWRVSYQKLRARAWCESRFDPYARNANSTASGLFQFLYPSTWNTTRYARHSVFSAKWSSLAAAHMEHIGRGGEWACTG